MVRVGVVILPEHHWPAAARKWAKAEALGFDHAWTYDHLAWRDLRDSTWFAAVPTLAAAATATSTIRLGTLVASPNFRHPVPFARELLTLDDISRGRLIVGIGSGGQGWDATILGQEPWDRRERQERFAEFVDLLDRLLTNREVNYSGHYWNATDARTHPGCVQQPRAPFAIAATGPKSMRVAVAYGSVWVTTGDASQEGPPLSAERGSAVVARQIRRLEQLCDEAGRDPATVDKLVLTGLQLDSGLRSTDEFRTVVDAYESVGVTDLVVHWPRTEPPFEGSESVLDAIAWRS